MGSRQQHEEEGWLTRERVLVLVLTVVTAIVCYLCYVVTLPFIPALTWALVLAVITQPLYQWIQRYIKIQWLASVLAIAIVMVTIALPAAAVVRQVVKEAVVVVEKVRADTAEDLWKEALERNRRLAPTLKWIEREVDLRAQVERVSDRVLAGLTRFVSGSIFIIMGWLITLFLLFYFLRDREFILRALRGFVPLSAKESTRIFNRVRDTIHALVFGTLAVSIVQGILGGIIFWALGLPAPLLWGAVMAVMAMLPVFGTALVWVPTALYLAIAGEWQKALILTAWGGIVIALIDNLLYPLLVRSKLRLHPVPVFIAILGGIIVFDATGIVLGPVILAVAVALLEIWRRRMADGGAVEAGIDTKT
jgi:predicted PurR-regulated permease PerM